MPAKKAKVGKAKDGQRQANVGVPEVVLGPIRALLQQMRALPAPIFRSLEELGLHTNFREVVEMSDIDVAAALQALADRVGVDVLDGGDIVYEIPSRSKANQVYLPELDRIVLKDKASKREFANVSTSHKAVITARVIDLVQELCSKGIHATKRDIFYSDVNLFQAQKESDTVLEDVACMLGCTRTSLNVTASEKGVVAGTLTFVENGDPIDCSRMGIGGKAIPPHMDKVTDIQSEAAFILLIEKDAAFMRLVEDRFYRTYPCIMLTAKGQPDVATRLFLRRLQRQLGLPVLGLFDADPYGLQILSVYMHGSQTMSYDSANLTTPNIKWLGVRPSDLEKYNLPPECRIPMTNRDKETGQRLMKEPWVMSNPAWVEELQLMLDSGEKAEIQALSSFGFQYLSQTYMPLKLQEGDWI